MRMPKNIKINDYTLEEILERHKHWIMEDWIMEDCDGWETMKADLSGADLSGADLRGAYLSGANNIPNIAMACPTDGSFIGWKKVNGYLIKLQIPEDAKRSSATTNKCRCDKALVLGIYDLDGTETEKNHYHK